ncbi:terpene synthase family protein [Streptacidiphilus melanogenes]|uniref:terpene synthase family protein n=1 Tax=Streptacidiphilus melanogenes TaxID=411235 RepID=UPI00126A3AE3|nr:hypothetical protein [Streptacidiphilus melanogenes]
MSTPVPFAVPRLFCPFDAAIHPEAEAVDRRAAAWVLELGAFLPDERSVKRTLAARSGLFAAMCMPHAEASRLETFARCGYWAAAFEEVYCAGGPTRTAPDLFLPLAARLVRATQSQDPKIAAGSRFLAGLQDLTRCFAQHASRHQMIRWTEAHRRWMTGNAELMAYRAAGRTPCLDDYLLTRLNSVGGDAFFTAQQMVVGPALSADECHAPAVRALVELATTVTTCDSDLLSAAGGGTGPNDISLTVILAREYRLSAEEAIAHAIALRDRALCRFLILQQQVASRAGAQLRAFLECLGRSIRANLDWSVSFLSARHAARGFTTPSLGAWADRPTNDSPHAPPLSAIAWLWDDFPC